MSTGVFNSERGQVWGNYRGTVVSTADPEKLGRCRVRVLPYFAGIKDEDLPWATPAMPILAGAGSGYGNFHVPQVKSWVWVFFEAGDFYQPVYFAEAQDGVHGLPADRREGYPQNRVGRTPSGIQLSIDDKNQTLEVQHPSGTYIKVLFDGSVEVGSTAKVGFVSAEDTSVVSAQNVGVTSGESVLLSAGKNVGVTAGGVSLLSTGKTVVESLGTIEATAGLSVTVKAPLVSVVAGSVNVTGASVNVSAGQLSLDVGSLDVSGYTNFTGPVVINGVLQKDD